MIVGVVVTDNREDEIAGAVRSVVDRVDLVLIVDTGVTDRTIERATEVAGDKLIVLEHEWRDFSTARNEGLAGAKELGAKWALFVDSDERLDFGALDLHRTLAQTRADVLLVEADDGSYPKQRIIRIGSDAHFYGPTHEALLGGTRELLRDITFHELPKTDEQLTRKCVRDVELLISFIAEHPEDPRWHYYLGSALEGLGQIEKAAEAFGRCVELRKIGDEAAWAAFKQAEQLFLLDRFEEAVAAAARGAGANVTFVECACVAAEASLKLRQPDQAVAWARMAESGGRYRGSGPERLWFRDLPSFYERPYDVLRAALQDASARSKADSDFHSAKLARVRAVESLRDHDLDQISVSRWAPAPNRADARSMLRPPALSRFCPSARATRIQFEPLGGRLPMNPSICLHKGVLWCVVRAVNYSMNGREYTVHDPHGVVRTENYLGCLTSDGRLVDIKPMLDLDASPRCASRIVGYEDVRLVSLKRGRAGSTLTGSATVCDRDPDGRRLIARLRFDSKGNVRRADVQPSNQLHEKNWMPLSVGGELTWIYSLDPTAVLPGPLRDCPFALEHLRGGAAMQFGTGYLCVMHEVIDEPEGRIYLHRFVRLDKHFNVTAVSPSWVFEHYGIEFCAGAVFSKGQIILSYGVEDREAWIMKISAKEIGAMKWIEPTR